MNIRIDSEFQALIPPLSSEERRQLEENLIENGGARDPLVVWTDAKDSGVIVDGHNRYEICKRRGLKFNIEETEFTSRDAAIVWIIDNQMGRRNLAPIDAVALAETKRPIVEGWARERMAMGGGDKRAGVESLPDPIENQGRTRDHLAEQAGVSGRTYDKLAKVIEKGTEELKQAVRENRVSADLAAKIADETPEEQAAIVAKGEKAAIIKEVKQKAEEAREKKRKEHAAKVEQAAAATVDAIVGPFDLVLADPPWRYDHQEAENRAIENHYTTATTDDICSHVPQSSDNCVLFLWATAPKLAESLRVMQSWGFVYKTHAIWDKQVVGMGYWFRGQHELLLVGTKGNPGATPECERRSSVFSEQRGKHSKKPQCVYEWIERAFPAAKKLEMYCRSPRPGWACWGNEI